MRYQIVVYEDHTRTKVHDILEVGTRKGNIPMWVIKNIQRYVTEGRHVLIEKPQWLIKEEIAKSEKGK